MALVLVAALIAIVAACGGKTTTSSSPAPPGPVVLRVVGAKGTRTFTLAQIQGLPAFQGYAGIKNSVGVVTPPVTWTGVRLTDLTTAVGGMGPKDAVTVVASDGYAMTFSYDQVFRNAFTVYDPATGNEQKPSTPLIILLAYACKGKPLTTDSGAPLRLVVAQPSFGQVVDGHWAVKWVDKVIINRAISAWTLNLQGAVTASVTRQSYMSCVAPGCHGVASKVGGNTYVGVPLYLFAGVVDDNLRHGTNAFNKALATRGYSIELISAHGHHVVLSSHRVAEAKDLILANTVDGHQLPGNEFPLRLVGKGLSKTQMVGGIVRIVLRLP